VNEDAELQAESARIERLLAELRDLVPLPAWQRIEDVLRAIVHLYGAGLGRALAHARASGADGEHFDTRLCDDELLASLLVLHGLHPVGLEERVQRALAVLREELSLADDALRLVRVGDGSVEIAASETIGGGAMSPGLAEATVRRVLETAAPEITSIEITGLPRPRDPSLVQLRASRSTP
jgi:hypothetical protein